jgi:hypothetical protein
MLCQKWMVQDLKEKGQERDVDWDAAKKIPAMKIFKGRVKDQEDAVNQVEVREKETDRNRYKQ